MEQPELNRMIFVLAYQDAARLFFEGGLVEILSGMPAGARVLTIEPDLRRQSFLIVAEHPSFPRTPDGAELMCHRIVLRQVEAPDQPPDDDKASYRAPDPLIRRERWDDASGTWVAVPTSVLGGVVHVQRRTPWS